MADSAPWSSVRRYASLTDIYLAYSTSYSDLSSVLWQQVLPFIWDGTGHSIKISKWSQKELKCFSTSQQSHEPLIHLRTSWPSNSSKNWPWFWGRRGSCRDSAEWDMVKANKFGTHKSTIHASLDKLQPVSWTYGGIYGQLWMHSTNFIPPFLSISQVNGVDNMSSCQQKHFFKLVVS